MLFNHLLKLRTLSQLEAMADSDRTTLLSEVLQMSPSSETWLTLYELLALWPENEAKLQALDVANRELEPWDDRLRSADTSSRTLFSGNHLSSLARIVRSIAIRRRGDQGRHDLHALATSHASSHLTRLSIVRSEIGRAAWLSMVQSRFLGNLQHLHVTNTVVGGDVFQALLQSPNLPRLRCLKLSEVGIDEGYLRVARNTRPIFHLQQVDFARNLLVHDGVVALAESPWLDSVESLALQHNHIREPAMRALLESPHIGRMKRIDLTNNDVTDDDRAALRRLADARHVQLAI